MRLFNRLILQTPESVELEFTLAGIGNRAYALIIDYIVLGLILIIFLVFWGFAAFFIVNNLGLKDIGIWLVAIQILLIFAIYVGYFVFFETLLQGQTPGKKFAKIRVIRDDGRSIRLQQAVLRALFRPVDELLFIGAFMIILSKQEKRLGDWVAGTLVIQDEEPVALANFPVSEAARIFANRLPNLCDMSRLIPEDFAVIREYLQRREGMIESARKEVSCQLANRIKSIITLDKVPSEVTAEIFLEAVYLAYQERR
jgi:uncharacterized RDD family membrane protein YckC